MADQPIGTLAAIFISAGLGILGKIVFDWLSKRGKSENGTAGEKSPSFWKEAFRDAVREELNNFEHRQPEVIRRIIRDEIRHFREREDR